MRSQRLKASIQRYAFLVFLLSIDGNQYAKNVMPEIFFINSCYFKKFSIFSSYLYTN